MDINVRIAGEAGQGVQTTGNLLVGSFAGLGLHVLAGQSYMSRIRGGLNWFDLRLADAELFSPRGRPELLVALTDAALEILRADVADGGMILYGGQSAEGAIAIDFSRAAKEVGAARVMANTVAAGAVYAVLGYDCDELCRYLAAQFKKKGDEVVQGNIKCARRGAELAGAHAGKVRAPAPAKAPAHVVGGAEAIGLGAATAGVKFVTAYPMTPSTATFTYLAGVADKYGIVVEQAEDEIAAVNMICGATYAGVPALATTSGGGFALMAEGLSLAGIMELPIVILLAQRPGPATGLPTRTAQQDLAFALHAGHGEFPRAIFAPGTHQQCYELTRRAFETAHKFQSPAIILTDQFLQDLQKNIPPLSDALRPIDRRVVEAAPAGYVRYAVTETGVSPRALPGGEGFVVCDSDEHLADGHITEDLQAHVAQQDKRMRKLEGLTAEALPPQWHGPREAETVLIAWGSTYGPCREAVEALNAERPVAAMMHFPQLWPIQRPAARELLGRRKRVISVEGNCTGQFASILREAGVLGECELVSRYDGLPLSAECILSEVRQ